MTQAIQISNNNQKNMEIDLHGDFDAFTALNLIHLLDKCASKGLAVMIDTNDLETISDLGMDVFASRGAHLTATEGKIIFNGKFRNLFAKP